MPKLGCPGQSGVGVLADGLAEEPLHLEMQKIPGPWLHEQVHPVQGPEWTFKGTVGGLKELWGLQKMKKTVSGLKNV